MKFVISVLIFSVVLAGFGLVYTDLGTQYNIPTNETNRTAYDRLKGTSDEPGILDFADTLQTNVTTSKVQDPNLLFTLAVQGAKVIKLIPAMFVSTQIISSQAATDIGIPSIFLAAFLAFVIIVISLAIAAAIMKWDI